MSQGCTCFSLHRSESFLDFPLVAVVGSGTLFSLPGQLKLLCFTTGSFPTPLQTYIIILVSGIIFKIPALVDLWTQILHVSILGGMGAHGQVLFAYRTQGTHANKNGTFIFQRNYRNGAALPRGLAFIIESGRGRLHIKGGDTTSKFTHRRE